MEKRDESRPLQFDMRVTDDTPLPVYEFRPSPLLSAQRCDTSASPESAEPAGESAPGRDGGTAGGAGVCCLDMVKARAVSRLLRDQDAALLPSLVQTFVLCPWC